MVDKKSPLDHCPTCQGPIEGFNGLRYYYSKSEEGFRWLANLSLYPTQGGLPAAGNCEPGDTGPGGQGGEEEEEIL